MFTLERALVRLALAIDEHLPGYADSYFGPEEWANESKRSGKLPLPDLTRRTDELAASIPRAIDWDSQRKDFLSHQVRAMQLTLRMPAGEPVSLAYEAQGLYDIQPARTDEGVFMEYRKWLDEDLPRGESLNRRLEDWQKSIEVPMEKVRELLPFITEILRRMTHRKFRLPEDESFVVEFVSDQPWMAYDRYLGEYRSRIEFNADIPIRVNDLVVTIAHEGYPGHHTELCTKDAIPAGQKGRREHLATLISSPWSVVAEGIAASALETLFSDQELIDFYHQEILPRAGMRHVEPGKILEIGRAELNARRLWGNAAIMLHEQKRSEAASVLQDFTRRAGYNCDH